MRRVIEGRPQLRERAFGPSTSVSNDLQRAVLGDRGGNSDSMDTSTTV